MAVPTVHNVQTFEADGSGDSYTVGTESDRVLVVIVSSETSGEDVNSVEFGGTALTEGAEAKEPSSGFLNTASVWYLPNPSGTASVTADFSSVSATIVALYLSGVDTASPIDTTATGTSSSSPNSVSITPSSSDAQVIAGFSQGNPDNFDLTGVDNTSVDFSSTNSKNTTNTLVGRVAPGGSTANVSCELVSGSLNRSAGILAAFAPSASSATYTVSGTVTESDGTTAIDGATVTLDNVAGANSQSTTTDANGNYSLSVTVADSDLPDTWDVTADASGFTAQTKQVSASTSSTSYTADFSLSGAAETVSFDTATALADGFDPALTATPNTISPGTGQAAAQGFPATITATQNTVSAGTAQATAQGFVPTITTGSNTVAATTGQAAAQGFDPTISEGAAGDTITADLGTAQAQGFAPSISPNSATVTLGLGQATASGFDPDVVADPSEINTGQAQAAATGFDPTITTNARTVAPQLGTAQADGFEPALVDGTVGVATTMEIEARPLYEIEVEVRPLYRIRLFVKEQLP